MKKIALSLLITTFISTVSFADDINKNNTPTSDTKQNNEVVQVADIIIGDPVMTIYDQNAALYFKITNKKTQDVAIIAAEVDKAIAEKTEMHATLTDEKGVARMDKIDKVIVPAGQDFEFKPLGHHVMVMGLNKDLASGDSVNVTVRFDDNTTQHFVVSVKK